jgi:tetratricopeptide (TPR) repeat protein
MLTKEIKIPYIYFYQYIVLIFIVYISIVSCQHKKENTPQEAIKDSVEYKISVLTQQLEKDPENPELLYKRAKLYYQKKTLYKGMEDIIRAISFDSTQSKYHLQLADFYYADNRIDDAKKSIEKAIKIDPEGIDANIKMGELLYYLGDYAKMFPYLDLALKKDPFNARIYFVKGMAFKEMGDTNLALSSFATTIEQDPDYFDAYMQLGNINSAKKNPIAIDYYNNAIRVNPGMIEAHYGLAYFLQENGKPDDAIRIYNNLLKIDAQNAATHHNIGYIFLFMKNDPQASIQWFEKSAKFNPKAANTFYHLGYAYEKTGNFNKAKENYKKANELIPEGFDLAKKRLKQLP